VIILNMATNQLHACGDFGLDSHDHISINNWYIQPIDGLKCLRGSGKHNKMAKKCHIYVSFKLFVEKWGKLIPG
jgi:hypothetical protein